ncbi:Mannosyl-oligosaccharide 1,2-alpha-mannosidase IB [Geranomyces michiganensis]|nr:Mannosyl-oligosaccharide 1,2-alpha-mannosidase IB [Geranomyces michiganensis]
MRGKKMPRARMLLYAAILMLLVYSWMHFPTAKRAGGSDQPPASPLRPPVKVQHKDDSAPGPEKGDFLHNPVAHADQKAAVVRPKVQEYEHKAKPEPPPPRAAVPEKPAQTAQGAGYPFPLFMGADRGSADTDMMERVKADGYVAYAPLADELRPVAGVKHNWYSAGSLLSTPVDSLDTLKIMGLTSRYEVAKKMVLDHLKVDFDSYVSLFETCIRVLGGLLSAYEFDPDSRYLAMAKDLGERFTHAFDTPSGFPVNSFNLHTKRAGGGNAGLAEMGTLQLELQYLSDVTGDLFYAEKALAVYDTLASAKVPVPGLYAMTWGTSSATAQPLGERYGIGAAADSFYEYLLKLWLSTGDKKYRDMYDLSAEAVRANLLINNGDHAYIPDASRMGADSWSRETSFHHLVGGVGDSTMQLGVCELNKQSIQTCFAGGMFATGALTNRRGKWTTYLDIGRRITETCWATYAATASGLGPEDVHIDGFAAKDSRYLLRPETIESIFYMHRFTHDPVYRDMGRAFVTALEKHCRKEKGFAGLLDVRSASSGPDDLQQSFFLAETLKYAYLLFTDDDVVPLEAYVFNTEAHPVSMRGYGRRKDIARGTVKREKK